MPPGRTSSGVHSPLPRACADRAPCGRASQALQELLESDDKWGFIIMDGNGSLYGTVSGNAREILHKFSVDLPKKHGRGGQSALRFARLRLEKRQNYVTKVAEMATNLFITSDKCNVSGLILAGSAEFKNVLFDAECFDGRLKAKVLKIVDVSYGGENGFNQAIELSAETLSNVKFIQEKKLISQYFEHISQDTGKFCFGVEDTLKGLEMGAVETLIVFENLDTERYQIKNTSTGEEDVKLFTPAQGADPSNFVTPEGVELEIIEQLALVEWLANNYQNFGARLEFVTNRSQEGSQFVKGFGGIGGILRYKVDFMELEEDDDEDAY